MLNREHILAQRPLRKEVEIPEWGGSVLVQGMDVAQAQAIKPQDGLAELVIVSVVNEDGTRMFSPEDKESLQKLDVRGLKRLADAVLELNGMTKTAVEDAAKNSEPGLNGASSSS
jgi:hypothetical protein